MGISFRKGKHLILILVCLLNLTFCQEGFGQTSPNVLWKEVNAKKKGTLPVHWYESRPFIFKTDKGALSGIEYDLINSFSAFVKKKYEVDLKIEWNEAEGFNSVLTKVVQSDVACFGASAFSITDKRKELVDFSPAYMSDIMVLISNRTVPLIESGEEFRSVFSNRTAITILGTTYEAELLGLKQRHNMAFEVEYIPSALNILETVESRANSFGFIDLSIYLMYYSSNPSISVKRQNFYPIKGAGYGFLIPKNSDWIEPVNAFFSQENFDQELEMLIGKYLDLDLYKLNEQLALQTNSKEELLLREKEIQYRDLLNKEKELESRTKTNYFLTALVVVAVFSSVVIIVQYVKRNQQRLKIEAQQEKIELANRQLEQRNQHLLVINEEKNNLIKILAHDMRQPLSQIVGLSNLLKNGSLPSDQQEIINLIMDSSNRLSRMITNILDVDAIESNRVEFVAEKVEITPLIQKVIGGFESVALKKGITIRLNKPKETQYVKADPLYLTQVMENLISNAIKFSPAGHGVTVSIYQVNESVRIAVQDEGPGISDEDKEKLFIKFQKLSARPTGGESSTGLGLAIVKRYVDLMGGKVWCKSEPGKGATFLVEFVIA
jgi:signal transduction histidine kinase